MDGVKPYYEHSGITIFHGDCREILPTLPKCDLVLTDPPYGINKDGMKASTSSHGGRKGFAGIHFEASESFPSSESWGSLAYSVSSKDADLALGRQLDALQIEK